FAGGAIGSAFGGGTDLSLKRIPPPAPLYPGIAQQFQQFASTIGPQAGQGLSEAITTGFPTDVGPAYEAMVAANRRQVAIGEQNLLENFGQMGLRHSSSALQ